MPKADGFLDTVADAWHSVPADGNAFRVLDNKLKVTARRLTSWSAKWIGNIKLQILVALEVISRFDMAAKNRCLSLEEMALKSVLKQETLGTFLSRAQHS